MALTVQSAMAKDQRTAKSVHLQHRHFAFIAATIAEIEDANQRYAIAQHFAWALNETNKNFNHERFMRAANAESLPVSVLTKR